jgi:trehalose 6-phosphate phosphatase
LRSVAASRSTSLLPRPLLLPHMTNQDVVVSEMGIAAGAALPPGPSSALLACRGLAAGAMSLRQTYLDLATAAARSASCTCVDAMRASSPTRSRAVTDVDEFTAWMVSSSSSSSPCDASSA